MYLVAPLEKQFSLLYTLLKEHIADDVDYKVCCLHTMSLHLVSLKMKMPLVGAHGFTQDYKIISFILHKNFSKFSYAPIK